MWQNLVRNWILQNARQRATEALHPKPPEEGVRSKPDGPPAAPREDCHVGCVFALSIEAGGLVDRLSGSVATHGQGFVCVEGGIGGRRVAIVEAGAGRERATHGAQALIVGHRPQWVISAGFAGGLAPQLRQGDIVMPRQLADTSGRELEIDFGIASETLAANPRLHLGRLLSVDRVIYQASEKRALGEKHNAVAVDMESLGVAEVCRSRKVRFLAVRVISDTVEHELPADVDRLVRQNSRAGRLGAATAAIFRRPSSVKDMWQLKEDALVASQRLATFLSGIIPQLP